MQKVVSNSEQGQDKQKQKQQDVKGLPGLDKTGGKTTISARRSATGSSGDGGTGGGKYLKIG